MENCFQLISKSNSGCLQDRTLALRSDGMGVVLDSALPHLIGVDDDLLSTGLKLYHIVVRYSPFVTS